MFGSIRNFKFFVWFYFFDIVLDEKINIGIVYYFIWVVIVCVKIYKIFEI